MNNYKYRVDFAEIDKNKKALFITIAWFETEEEANEYAEILKKDGINVIRSTAYDNKNIEEMIDKSLSDYKKIIP